MSYLEKVSLCFDGTFSRYLLLLAMTAEEGSHPFHNINTAQGLKSLFLGIARIGGYQYLCIPKYKR